MQWTAVGLFLISGFVLFLTAGALWVGDWLPWTKFALPMTVNAAGLVLASFGFGLVVWATVAFGLFGHGTPLPLLPPKRLVTRGPYRFVRNPIYIGWLAGFGGAALLTGRLTFLGVGLILFTLAVLVGYWERDATVSRLGPEFERWVRETPAFMPRRR